MAVKSRNQRSSKIRRHGAIPPDSGGAPRAEGLVRVVRHELVRTEDVDTSAGSRLEPHKAIRATELEDPIEASAAWREALPLRDDEDRDSTVVGMCGHRR